GLRDRPGWCAVEAPRIAAPPFMTCAFGSMGTAEMRASCQVPRHGDFVGIPRPYVAIYGLRCRRYALKLSMGTRAAAEFVVAPVARSVVGAGVTLRRRSARTP